MVFGGFGPASDNRPFFARFRSHGNELTGKRGISQLFSNVFTVKHLI
jgi:hypothetical protein